MYFKVCVLKCEKFGSHFSCQFLLLGTNVPNDKLTAVAKLCLSSTQSKDLERFTRKQSDEDLWHDTRRNQITGSKFGTL